MFDSKICNPDIHLFSAGNIQEESLSDSIFSTNFLSSSTFCFE